MPLRGNGTPVSRSDLVVWGYLDPAMRSLFLLKTKLKCAIWPIVLNSKNFVDPMLRNHTLNWLW